MLTQFPAAAFSLLHVLPWLILRVYSVYSVLGSVRWIGSCHSPPVHAESGSAVACCKLQQECKVKRVLRHVLDKPPAVNRASGGL